MAIKFVNTPGISQIQLYLEVIEGTQDVANNRTTVTYKAYLYNQYYNYYYNWNDTSMTVTVNGTVVATNSAVKYDFRTGPREQAVLTGTAVIPHNSDGTKTLAASVALEGPSYRGPGTVTLNLSLPLTTIPRATEFTAMSAFNSSSTSISVTADVKSTAFTNKFSLVVNSKPIGTWTNPTFSSGNASLALSTTHHNNLLAALPTQTSATATMTLQTLSGTTVIGTRTKSATYTILADVKPVITSSTIGNVPTTGAISGTERAYAIQGVSAISVSWSHTIPTGTTLASGTVSMGGVTKNTNPASFQATTAGTNTAVITVKDKRGRIGTKSLSIDVTAYSPISAQLLYLGRPRAEGSNQARLQAEVKHVVSTLSDNKYDVIIKTKEVGTSTWTTVLNSRYTPNATHTRVYNPTTVYDELKAFDTMITVADDYSTATLLGVLPTAAYPLVIGKYGIGVGKVPQDDRVLDVGGAAYFEEMGYHNVPSGANLNDYTTPGFYYCSMNATVATMSNTPNSQAFGLIVIRSAGIVQMWFQYNTRNVYLRAMYNNNWGTWGLINGPSSIAWDNVTGKPLTFPPSSHTHSYAAVTHNHSAANITSGQLALARIPVQKGTTTINNTDKTITFPTAFAGVPSVTMTYATTDVNAAGDHGCIKIHHLTKSNFQVTNSGTATWRAVNWIAVY